ncbi:transposase [Streptomyces parvulus]|uniref:TetR-like C-terminal domain-containing protein n=1 Tax=Streptomyces parvulus TaxID=146923 RepID=UPI003F54043C
MWDRIEPLMPADPIRGRRWADHRRTLEAIAWKYHTCSPWRDLPDELGSFDVILGRAAARGERTPGTETVVDHVVAPLMYRILFRPDGLDAARARSLVALVLAGTG